MRRFLASLAFLLCLPVATLATTHEPNPEDLEARFQRGMAAIGEAIATPEADHRATLLDEAISVFHAMLVANPGLLRVRLELAHAFFLKGEDSLARQHFEEVLAGEVPPAVRTNVNRFLAEIRARRRWSFNLGFALAPDTNIGATSEERIIYIYGLPFERSAEDLATSGVGLSAWLSGEYQFPLGDTRRLWTGADVSRRDYAGSRFDQTFVSVYGGPRWLVGTKAEASMLASLQRRWIGGGQLYDAHGVRLEASSQLSRQATTFARMSYHNRGYRTETQLDGPVADIIVGGAWIVRSTVRAHGALGWGQERTDLERWRHERKWLRLGVSVALPRGFTVGGSGEIRWADYEGNWYPHTTGGEAREDRTRSLRISVHNRAFAWKGFSPRLSLVHEVRDTNAQLYDYRRTGGELSLVRVF